MKIVIYTADEQVAMETESTEELFGFLFGYNGINRSMPAQVMPTRYLMEGEQVEELRIIVGWADSGSDPFPDPHDGGCQYV